VSLQILSPHARTPPTLDAPVSSHASSSAHCRQAFLCLFCALPADLIVMDYLADRFYTGKPTVPFGFGLSYSNFSYELLPTSTSSPVASPIPLQRVVAALAPYQQAQTFVPQRVVDALGTIVQHTVLVTNTGRLDADDVVLGFVRPPGAGRNGVPLKMLYDFQRVTVAAGHSVNVTLNATALTFTQVDESGARKILHGRYVFQFGIPETSAMGQGFAFSDVVTTA
jgi:hypothetical protein